MKPNRRALFAVLLAAVSGLAACDRPDGGGGLAGPDGPQFARNVKSIKILRSVNPLTQDIRYESKSPINSKGGVFTFGSNTLTVQRNSVQGPTLFSATIRAGEEIRIDLRAWEPNGTPVTTFKIPVKLTLDLSGVAEDLGTDIRKVVIVFHDPNGTLEVMPSSVDPKTNTVSAMLNHFSDYSPGWSKVDEPTPEP